MCICMMNKVFGWARTFKKTFLPENQKCEFSAENVRRMKMCKIKIVSWSVIPEKFPLKLIRRYQNWSTFVIMFRACSQCLCTMTCSRWLRHEYDDFPKWPILRTFKKICFSMRRPWFYKIHWFSIKNCSEVHRNITFHLFLETQFLCYCSSESQIHWFSIENWHWILWNRVI